LKTSIASYWWDDHSVTAPKDQPALDVALFGGYPPPYGGVSVHIERLHRYLWAHDLPCRVWDTYRKTYRPEQGIRPLGKPKLLSYLWRMMTGKAKVVHIHTSRNAIRVLSAIACKLGGKKLVITVHGSSLASGFGAGSNAMSRSLTRWAMRRASHVFAVNEDIHRLCLDIGVGPDRVTTLPAFIPLPAEDVSADNLPGQVADFIDNHGPTLVGAGWFGAVINGKDVYRFDVMLRALARLREQFPNIGQVILVSGTHDEEARQYVTDLQAELGLDEAVLFVDGVNTEVACSIYDACDVFVRPTTSDGDSVALREALHLGKPSVVSDAIPRPAGCVVFETDDLDGYVAALVDVLADIPAAQATLAATQAGMPGPEIYLNVYRSLLD
jgi:glycosyltransferase involved in cell wall biosynthesis